MSCGATLKFLTTCHGFQSFIFLYHGHFVIEPLHYHIKMYRLNTMIKKKNTKLGHYAFVDSSSWLTAFTLKGKLYQGSRAGASAGRTHHASERTGSHGAPC